MDPRRRACSPRQLPPSSPQPGESLARSLTRGPLDEEKRAARRGYERSLRVASRTDCHPQHCSPRALLSRGPQSHEAADHRRLPWARPAEPLEELPASHPGSLHGYGSCSEGSGRTIRAGWQGLDSAVAPRGQPPCSGCSQGVQPVPGAGRARPGLTARGADPTRLGEPQEARQGGGQETAPCATAAASPATCADLEKQSAGPAAACTPGPGRPGSPAPRDPAANPGCAPNPATRAAHGVSTREGNGGWGKRGLGLGLCTHYWRAMQARGEGAGLWPSSLWPQYCRETAPRPLSKSLGEREITSSPFRTSFPRPDVKSFPNAPLHSSAFGLPVPADAGCAAGVREGGGRGQQGGRSGHLRPRGGSVGTEGG